MMTFITRYFICKKIGIIFVLYTTVLAVVYPIVFKTSFSLLYIASLTFILSLNLLVQYMFALTYKTLLNADKKVYVVSLTQSFIVSLSIVFSILAVKVYPSVHILKLISGLLFFVKIKQIANPNIAIKLHSKKM